MGRQSTRFLVLDAGALVGFDRQDRRVDVLIRRSRERSVGFLVPAGVLAQVWRNGSEQARLAALIAGQDLNVVALTTPVAKSAGEICARSHTGDAIDATVVLTAREYGAPVATSDAGDLLRLDPSLDLIHV